MLNITYGNIKIFFSNEINGGGITFNDEFLNAIKFIFKDRSITQVNHIYEFCAGPGFLGFSCLSKGLCNRLTLSDINQKAIDACNQTVKYNNLEDKVNVILSDGLNDIPHQQFDLIIANPPHLNPNISLTDLIPDVPPVIYTDQNWAIHEKFYNNVKYYLHNDSDILFIENIVGNGQEIFKNQISEAGLTLEAIFSYPESDNYFVWSKID